MFHSISNRARGKRLSLPRLRTVSTQARNCTTFTLHDLTDCYVERVTVHRIKINDPSCFHNLWPLQNKTKIKPSLGTRGPPGVSGAIRSLRILHIGRISSGAMVCIPCGYKVLLLLTGIRDRCPIILFSLLFVCCAGY